MEIKKKKKEKTPGDMILHNCTKNYGHMLYCSWDMACDRCNCYFSFWVLTAQKVKISKTRKKRPGDVIISHVYQKLGLDDVWFLWYDVRQMDKQTTDRLTDRKSDI